MSLQKIPHDTTKYRNNSVELINISSRNRIGSQYYLSNYTTLFIAGTGENNSTTITDLTGKTVTRNGNTKISTTQSIIDGSSIYFDGSGDYLSLPASTAFTFAGDFTIDLWFRYNSISDAILISQRYNSTWGFIINPVSVSRLYTVFMGQALDITTGISFSTSAWFHIAAVRIGQVITVYVNGVSKGTISVSGTIGYSEPTNIIGISPIDLSTSPLNGYLSHIRIINGQALWTSNFTPPSTIAEYYSAIRNNYIGA